MKKNNLFLAIALLATLYLTYGVVLRIPFAFHNDLGALTYTHGTGPLAWPEGKQLIPIGRFLNCLMANYQFSFIEKVSDFTAFRAVSIAIVGIMTIASWLWLAGFAMDSVPAAAVALSLFLLPTMQLSVVWNTQLVPNVAPMLLVLTAGWLLHRKPASQAAGLRAGIGKRTVATGVAACLLLTVVNFIYPPTAALILVPTLACVLFLPRAAWPGTRLLVARDLTIYFLSCLLFFALQKAIVGPYTATLLPPGLEHGDPSFRLEIASRLLENFRDVFGTAGPIALHLWDITASWWSLAAVLATLVVGLALALLRPKGTDGAPTGASTWIQYGIAVAALIVAANTPNLLCPQALIAFRVLFAMSAMTALLAIRCLLRAVEVCAKNNSLFVERLVTLALAAVVAASAQATLSGAAMNAYLELDVARSYMQPNHLIEQVGVLHRMRGIGDNARLSPRPTQFINPVDNLLGVYLPLEFGLWHKPEDLYKLLAREWAGLPVNQPLELNRFLAHVRVGPAAWTRPNPWPAFLPE